MCFLNFHSKLTVPEPFHSLFSSHFKRENKVKKEEKIKRVENYFSSYCFVTKKNWRERKQEHIYKLYYHFFLTYKFLSKSHQTRN